MSKGLLIEFIEKYITESSIARDSKTLKYIEAMVEYSAMNKEEQQRLVDVCFEKIHALKHHRILKPLGSGEHGTALLLSNGNVLKIYAPRDEDDAWYENLQSLAFSGKGSRYSPMVYDYGFIKDNLLAFVEMSRIVTLKDYLKFQKRDFNTIEKEIDAFDDECFRPHAKFRETMSLPYNERKKLILTRIDHHLVSLSLGERHKLSKAIMAVVDTVHSKKFDLDLNVNNVGVDQVSGAWMLFDI
jgi:hypothetical protein